MKPFLKGLVFFILAALLGGIIGFGTYHLFNEDDQTEINSSLLKNQIQSSLELTTTKYHYTNAGAFENQHNFYGWNIPFTRSNFIVSYDGRIHAGVDLEQVEVKINGDTIHIHLPKAQVLSHEIDQESIQVLDENSSTFNKIEIADFQDFAVQQKEKVEQDAIDKGLLEESQTQAKKGIQSILEVHPQIESGQYQLKFS